MAELPRYKRGASLISLPTVDFMQTGSAAARAYGNVASSLDKMAQFTSERYQREATREGIEYDFRQGPSLDQVELALEQNRSLDEIVGDEDTVFGAASRASAGVRLRTEAEIRAKNLTTQYLAKVDAGEQIDIAELQKEFSGQVQGYADILLQVDPEQAAAYKATTATLGNTVWKAALTNNLKIDAAVRIKKADDELSSAQENITMILKNGGEGSRSAAAVATRQLDSIILATNNVKYIQENASKPREIYTSAVVNAVADLSMAARASDPVKFSESLAIGVMPDDYTQSLYDSLDQDEKLNMLEELRKRASEQNAAAEAAYKQEEISLRNAYTDARATVYDPSASEQERDDARATMRRIGGMGVVGYEPEKVEGDISAATDASIPKQPTSVDIVLNMIERDEISETDHLDDVMDSYGIKNPSDVLKLTKAISADTKADQIELRRLARIVAKVADEQIASAEQQTAMIDFEDKVQRAYNSEFAAWSVEAKGPAPSIPQVAQKIAEAERVSIFTKNIQLEVQSIQDILDKAKISITVSEYTKFEELEELLEDADVKSGQITQIKNTLKSIKENQKSRKNVGY